MSLHVQMLTMGLMLASGVGIGILFDLYRVLAHELRFPRWLIPLLDLAYWAAATFAVFRVLLFSNFGQVRFFVFLGLFAGYTLYFLGLSRTSVKLIRWIIGVVEAMVRFFVKAFHILVITPVMALYRCVVVILRYSTKVAIFICKLVVQLLYPVRLLFRWIGRALKPYLKVPGWILKPWRRFTGWLKR
ncbi:spore cortex biosynthesis protein YabQ [Gorillibacterium sp. sgz5001074]|uniref:spore cortex biosynthesis protein YabQ n=1 Tax=Gorillibacterium sp. sgz5001074 TaxID=3446695 RepID=UPI003F663B6E